MPDKVFAITVKPPKGFRSVRNPRRLAKPHTFGPMDGERWTLPGARAIAKRAFRAALGGDGTTVELRVDGSLVYSATQKNGKIEEQNHTPAPAKKKSAAKPSTKKKGA